MLTPATRVNGATVKPTRVSASIPIPAAMSTRLRESTAPAIASIAATSNPPGTMTVTMAAPLLDSACTLSARQVSCGPISAYIVCSGGLSQVAHGSESSITVWLIDHIAMAATGAAARTTSNTVMRRALGTPGKPSTSAIVYITASGVKLPQVPHYSTRTNFNVGAKCT